MENEIRLRPGKLWHFNVIYNNAKSRMSQTDDTKLSLEVTEKLVDLAKQWGHTKSYYTERDALPRQNVFGELFAVIEGSEYTIVIITKDFHDNYWTDYSQMAAFKRLLEKNKSNKVIGVLVGVSEEQLPENLLLNKYVSFSHTDWNNDNDTSWTLLKQMMKDPPTVPGDTRPEQGIQQSFATNSSGTSSPHTAVEAGSGVVQTLPKIQQPSGTDDETHLKYSFYQKTEQRERGSQPIQNLPSGPALPCHREQGCQQSTPQGASNTPAKQEMTLPVRPRDTNTPCDTASATVQGVSDAASSMAISTQGNAERSNATHTASSTSQDPFKTETTEKTLADNTLRTAQLGLQNKPNDLHLQSSRPSEDLETDRGSLSLPIQRVTPDMPSGELNLSTGSHDQISFIKNVNRSSNKNGSASENNNQGPQINDAARTPVKDTDKSFEKGSLGLHGKHIPNPRTSEDNQQIGRRSQELDVNRVGNDKLLHTQNQDAGLLNSRKPSLNLKSLEGDRKFQGEQEEPCGETFVKEVASHNDNNRSPPDGCESGFCETDDPSREGNSTQPKSRLTSSF